MRTKLPPSLTGFWFAEKNADKVARESPLQLQGRRPRIPRRSAVHAAARETPSHPSQISGVYNRLLVFYNACYNLHMSRITKLFLFVSGLLILGIGTFSSVLQPLFQGGSGSEVVEEQQEEKSQDEWINIAIAHEAKGDMESATDAYRQAIAIQEASAIPWINLAALLKKQGEYGKAAEAYENFIRIFPLSTQGYANLAELYVMWQEGSLQDAIEVLEIGIEQTSDEGLKKEKERLEQNL